jgi:hypothetical protein
LIIRPDRPFTYQQIDRKLVSVRNRIGQKGIVCQREKKIPYVAAGCVRDTMRERQ